MTGGSFRPDEYRDILYRVQRITANVGFMANIIENHDEPRGVSRYLPDGGCTEKSKKMLAAVLMMLRGLPFIYQGQEIGMENCAFKNIEEMDDLIPGTSIGWLWLPDAQRSRPWRRCSATAGTTAGRRSSGMPGQRQDLPQGRPG